jgi:hypothetical protein
MAKISWVLVVVLAACSTSKSTSPTGFEIATNSATEFDATLHDGAAWARIIVRYTPSTTYYELTTSTGRLAFSGTEIAFGAGNAAIEASVAELLGDPRATDDGYVILTAGDREYDLVESLHDRLLASGAAASPTLAQKGTTLYAAAYTSARVLGMLYQEHEPGTVGTHENEMPATWPYPGYDDVKLMPTELAAAGVTWGVSCCGPNNCNNCEQYNAGFVCGDWCAAGDHCNARHPRGRRWPNGGGCGTINTWPGHCPHQDSNKINRYDWITSNPAGYDYCRRHTNRGY